MRSPRVAHEEAAAERDHALEQLLDGALQRLQRLVEVLPEPRGQLPGGHACGPAAQVGGSIFSSVLCGVVFLLRGLIKSKLTDNGGAPDPVRVYGHTD